MIEKYEVGTILWKMVGKRRNAEIKWYAEPNCIEYTDEHKYLFGDGCGGSWNNIGKNIFLSRQECIDHFLEKHDSLTQKIDIEDKSPDGVYDLPRTDWQTVKVVRFDSVTATSVYQGGFGKLVNVTNEIPWKSEYVKGLEMYVEHITLEEIYQHFAKQGYRYLITVFVDDPMRSTIYQCGNYEDGKWVRLGNVMGYA